MGKDKITNWLQWLFLGGIVGITCIFVYKNIKVIISYCNTNQGFFSALLGFLAILISVLTYYNQKKEQTKNAQENAKLQRELTEQNNKLQVDLQLRQIKLDSYNLRYECWRRLNNLIRLLKQFNMVWCPSFKEQINSFYYSLDINELSIIEYKESFEQSFSFLNNINKSLLDVIRYKFILIQQHQIILNELLNIILEIQDKLNDFRSEYFAIGEYGELKEFFDIEKNDIEELGKRIYNNINGYDKKIKKIIEGVEQDLDISELHKINMIK